MTTPRPNPTTMEGMIWNANLVLEDALKPNINGMPKNLFQKCVGIVFVNSVQLGCIFAGSIGGGIALRKNPDGSWSPPCAVSAGGISFGLLVGISAQDLIIFVFDDDTLKSIAKKHGAKLGAQLELTVGPFGRAAQVTDTFSKGGVGATATVAYTKGAFAGFSAEGGKLGVREFVNNKFYNASTNGEDILFTPGSVKIPEGKVTMLQEVYDKLDKLSEGKAAEPDAAEQSKKEAAKEVADKEGEAVKADPEAEVVEVDAAAEAAKE